MGLLSRLLGKKDAAAATSTDSTTPKPYEYDGPKIPQKPLTPREIEEMHAQLFPAKHEPVEPEPWWPLYDPESGKPLYEISLEDKFSATPADQPQSPLFRLPPEVRAQIWSYAMGSQKLYLTSKNERLIQAEKMNEFKWWPKRGLLNVPMICRAAYLESISCLYSNNTFCIGFGSNDIKVPLTSIDTLLPPQHIAAIQHLEVGWHFIRGYTQYYDSHPQAWDFSIVICSPDSDQVWNEFCAKMAQLSNLKTLKIVVWTSGDRRAEFKTLEKDTLAPLKQMKHLKDFNIFLPWPQDDKTLWQDAPFSISRRFEDRSTYGVSIPKY
ncbi:hypothetical protein MRS44_011595 [Fusarium solani]|uniref:DUF7730 domain-containing protein n=1 Tax=Fusarium solani TaxID=169388 RepID=A0A9P9R7M8_FUSSL|nr:uncharacterized protein B0J15DRAFT_578073 [Fusarium solani]KAH7268120.1 hypothetical protein B0J15DRAFT_578073 [Fusarium solani]KAJ3460728.1 hypothetical protein MRS44_011595 [Fusarium solani]